MYIRVRIYFVVATTCVLMDKCQTPLASSNSAGLEEVAADCFTKVGKYLQSELSTTIDNYRLLEELNQASVAKYGDLKQTATSIASAVQEVNDKYKGLEPYLSQIDSIETQVAKLEETAYKLDAYSKNLEAKFKEIEKSHQK